MTDILTEELVRLWKESDVSHFKELSQHIWNNWGKPRAMSVRIPGLRAELEPGTPWIRDRSANHYFATLCDESLRKIRSHCETYHRSEQFLCHSSVQPRQNAHEQRWWYSEKMSGGGNRSIYCYGQCLLDVIRFTSAATLLFYNTEGRWNRERIQEWRRIYMPKIILQKQNVHREAQCMPAKQGKVPVLTKYYSMKTSHT